MTHEQYILYLKQLRYHQQMVEQLLKQTRAYIYAQEAQRVQDKKQDSERYYRTNPDGV